MNSFEKLKQINIGEMHSRTHISITELQALLAKRYDGFNRAKGLGFFKILEREYDLDLSETIAEYELYCGAQSPTEEIFIAAKEEKGSAGKWLAAIFIAIAALLVGLFLQFSGNMSVTARDDRRAAPPQERVATENAIVSKAREALAASAAKAENGNGAIVSTSGNTIEAQTNPEVTPIAGNDTPMIAVIETPTIIEPITPIAPSPSNTLFVVPERTLWIGIVYLDSDRREQKTISSRYQFESNASQEITFGHGRFKLAYGTQVIEPKSELTQRIRFRNGAITQLSTAQQTRAREAALMGETSAEAGN